jgi:microcystin-dependent protein
MGTGPVLLKAADPYTDPQFKSAVEQVVKATLDVAGRVVWDIIDEEPRGWLIANGQAVTTAFPVLRKKLIDASSPHGSSGGNPLLPDLRNRMAVGSGSTYTLGATGGAATHTLSSSEIPSHRHTISDSGDHTHTLRNPATGNAPVWDYVGSGGATRGHYRNPINPTGWSNELYAHNGGNHNHGGNTGYTGDGGSHNNMPPYVGLVPLVRAY